MSIGAQLRASREARGLTIEALARTTRVQPRILAAIERDDVAVVPPRPFGRGFVRAYAEEMGLDGDQTARDYFAQFAAVTVPPAPAQEPVPGPLASSSRVWILVVAVAGMIAGILLALLVAPPARSQGPAAVREPSAGPAPARTAAEPALDPPATLPPIAAPTAAPDPNAAPVTIVLTAGRPAWVAATADGRRALYGTVAPGAPATVTAQREVVLRVGDAGALTWRINGREVGAMGRPGQVRDVRITPLTAAAIR
jgi:cytoskeletal protein RodZ